MEEERFEDVIDAYESGVGVESGESLTDYILSLIHISEPTRPY